MCTLLDHLVCYGSNQSLCVASRGLRYNLDQNKPMHTCVRPHCNFRQLWRNEKRSHNPHLNSKYMISLAGNSKAIEKLTLWLKFLANCFLQSQDDSLGVPRSRYGVLRSGGDPQSRDVPQTGVVPDLIIKWKHFPRYWTFVRGIHWAPVNSPHEGQWRGALVFSLICALNKRGKQSWGWWFETPSHSLWRHCNDRPELMDFSKVSLSTTNPFS